VALADEIARLKKEEARYNSAYGAGVFTVEQLREYVVPIRSKIAAAEVRIKRLDQQEGEPTISVIPNQAELREFARRSSEKLSDLNFAAKRAIVLKTVENVTGDQQQLHIYGHIPITNDVNVFTNDRHGQCIDKHGRGDELAKSIPFAFKISLPPPNYQTISTKHKISFGVRGNAEAQPVRAADAR
jgi:site-specific DNA recombinase